MIPAVSETASAQQQLRILFVEDSLPDAELCLRELQKAGFEVTADIVHAPEEFEHYLSSNSYDLVLADYNLPRWTGIDALKHLKNQDKGIPFILVTGTLGEETAVECIKQGATDYILKDALTRLPVAIRKALKEKALREERKQAERALRKSEARFRALVETTSDWVWEVNREGQYTYASSKVRELLGYEPEEILGKTPFELMPPDEGERFTRVIQEIVASERPFAWLENTNLHKDGRPVVLETSVVSFFDEKGNLLGYRGIGRDITERKQAQETREALYRASLEIQEPLDLEERLNRLLTAAKTVLALDRINILLADSEGRWLEAVASAGTHEPIGDIRVPIGPDGGAVAQAYLTKQAILWDGQRPVPEDLRLKPPYDRIDAFRSRVFANVPLVAQGRAIGVLGVDRRYSRQPLEPRTIELLQLFAAQAALAIDNARLFQEIATRNQSLIALNRVAQAANQTLDLQKTLDSILDATLEAVGGKGGIVRLWDEQQGRLQIAAHRAINARYVDRMQHFRPGEGFAGQAFQSGEVLVVGDIERYAHLHELARHDGIFSLASIPIRFREKKVGTLSIFTKSPRPFSLPHIDLLRAIGNQIGTAIENARLFEENEKHANELAALNAELHRENTERKQAEQKLRLQVTALETAANGILITDREGTIIWANPAFTFLTGYTTEEIIGQNPRILKSGKQDPSFYESLWSTILAGQVWQGEVINRRKDGSLYTEEQTVTPVRDEKGEVSYFVAIKQDITERKRMEEALRESEVRFRTLAHGSPVGIFRTDATGHCTFLNGRGSEIIGLTPEAAAGHGWTQTVHPDDRNRVLAEWHMAVEKKLQFRSEYRFERPDGGINWVFGQALPEEGPAGEITSYVGTITDITERRQAEEELKSAQLQLIQSAKFESVGRLAAGVAHEVKNPLAIIQYGLGYLSQALSTPEDDKVASVLGKMGNAVQRADKVIRGLLNFSASSTLEITAGDLNAVVEESLLLMHYETVRARVTVVKALAETLPPVKLDPHKIGQVLVNVITNAIQAMPDGGTLTVTTAPKSFSALHPGVSRRRTDVFPSGATAVLVEVDDTGTGIPAETLDRVFDPFFTTKPIGEGTGLGLSVTRKIMELHEGIIDIRNRQKGGVRVTLVFPADGGQDDGQEANTAC